MRDGTKGKSKANPKKTLTWAERLAQLPEEEAAALRAKANTASKRSRAAKRGKTPEELVTDRLEARLQKLDERQTAINAERQDIGEQLGDARAALKAAKEAAEAEEAGDVE